MATTPKTTTSHAQAVAASQPTGSTKTQAQLAAEKAAGLGKTGKEAKTPPQEPAETLPYIEITKQAVQLPNPNYAQALTKYEQELAEAEAIEAEEEDSGGERDEVNPAIVHAGEGADRIETEAEKEARKKAELKGAGMGSRRLAAEQAAGKAALASRKDNGEKEAAAGKHATAERSTDRSERGERSTEHSSR